MSSQKISRRSFLATCSAVTGGVAAAALPARAGAPSAAAVAGGSHADVRWRDASEWGVEGRGWDTTIRYYDRLPGRAEGLVREPVWNLSRHSAGMRVGFETDAADIHVRYKLLSDRLAMPHMPATGVSGVDLYAEDAQGQERWVNVTRPNAQEMEVAIAEGLAPGMRRYAMYLPLYNGVEQLEIGVDASATFQPIAPRSKNAIVFYGTSIMHGACASRPGMAIPAILGRRLELPVINLGFSGNGRMEPEMADLISELDPQAFVVDCVPNMNAEMINERAIPLVRRLIAAHPGTPVLLVEDRAFSSTPFFPRRGAAHRSNRRALRDAYDLLRDEMPNNIFYLAGDELMGSDGEGATDGSHPSDLGMMRYADAYEPALRTMLGKF